MQYLFTINFKFQPGLSRELHFSKQKQSFAFFVGNQNTPEIEGITRRYF
jgi:hypothetical protein